MDGLGIADPSLVPRFSPRATVVDYVLGGWDDVPGFGPLYATCMILMRQICSIASEEGCV